MITLNQTIDIANDFTKFTGLRYERLTEGVSGEKFRDEFLIPAIDKFGSITVILDGNIGEYLPSFLEECFGGLIRDKNYSFKEFKEIVTLVSNDDPILIDDILYYVNEEIQK